MQASVWLPAASRKFHLRKAHFIAPQACAAQPTLVIWGSETRQQHEFPAMLHWIYSIACQHLVAIDITQPATRWKKASR
jgi:hypothetical protein